MNPIKLSFLIFVCVCFSPLCELGIAQQMVGIDVGVVLDLETWVGKMSLACISMAVADFYSASRNFNNTLVLHVRDSKRDIVGTAAQAVDLLKTIQVKAIIGPQKSTAAEFVVDLGDKAQVPILSFSATSPSLSSTKTPYFIRTAHNDSSQVKAIAAIVRAFGWRQVVPIYEDSDYGNGVIPYLTDAFQEIDARVPNRSVIHPFATDDQIVEELYKLMTMQTRVFVVHMTSSLGSRLFLKAIEIGMMSPGYAWIITDGLANVLDSMDYSVIDSMQGVLGVKPYVPRSKELDNFTSRWRRKILLENPNIRKPELSISGLLAYDTVRALAAAVDRVGSIKSKFKEPKAHQKSTYLTSLGVSETGPAFLKAISNTEFKGLSGHFRLVNGQLQSSAFQIINVAGKGGREIGFWTPESGLSRVLDKTATERLYSTSTDDLKPVIWPGESTAVPKGWAMTTNGNKLRIGVPVKDGFSDFVRVVWNPVDNSTSVSGYCIDVFDAVREQLPYSLPFDYVPFGYPDGRSAGTYNDLIYQVFLQKLDAVVGDTTIIANRSLYVDFTLPYTESGVSMVVPIKGDERKNAWIFLKPLSGNLWVTSAVAFIVTGFVVWVLEHRINDDFRGPPSHQIGVMFWFSFSTLVFAHKEKVVSNLSRFVVIIWLFVVLILTSSYTASLTSMLTVERLQPTITDVQDLIKKGDYVGYQQGSFVVGLLKNLKFDESKLKAYNSPDDYAEALSKGSGNGGVAAIFDEIPYIKLFLFNAKYCGQYMMVGPTYKTDGFGFVFPIGSPLVSEFSRAILKVTEGDKMVQIEQDRFGQQAACREPSSTITSNSLTLDSFWALFVIVGTASLLALFIFVVRFFYRNWNILNDPQKPKTSLKEWLVEFAMLFDEKDRSSHPFNREAEAATGQTSTPATNGSQSPASNFNGSHLPPGGGGTPSPEIDDETGDASPNLVYDGIAGGDIMGTPETNDRR